ncbi:MAG TPA: RNA polymerase subunit sigma-70 [Solirubrobacteraceae bacterium]|nr:RNA polymerase subunit sigma-70 [Solirubrobacteraceae bacterium]
MNDTTDTERAARTRLARAQRGDERAFEALTEPHRRELQLHCYRILGSLQDAEDLLQETLLAAWRGLEQFEGRSSLRTWLYTIATNRCLNALRERQRRPRAALAPRESYGEIPWLQPYPDQLLEGIADAEPGPEARYEAKETVALAFVAALQQLPPRQRAVLVLRDVLGFHAEEAAEMLGASRASVNSALARARSVLESRAAASRERLRLPAGDELVLRFADAFERDDIDAVVEMLTDDAVVSMPPEPEWFAGRAAIGEFLRERHAARAARWRFAPVGANLQPAYAYFIESGGRFRLSGMFVISARPDGIESVTRFAGRRLLSRLDVPRELD